MGVATQAEVDALINIGGRKLRGNEYAVKVDEAANKSIKNILERLGVTLTAKLSELAPSSSGKLDSSIHIIGVTEKDGYWRLEVGFGSAEYPDYIDKGVRGWESKESTARGVKTYPNKDGRYYQFRTKGMPKAALDGLTSWAARKNIELKATELIKGRRNKKIISPAASLAYNIKKKGIAGRMFKKKAIEATTPKYKTELQEVSLNSLVLKISK